MTTAEQVLACITLVLSGVLAGGIVNVGVVQVPTILGLPSDVGLITKNLLHTSTERYLPWVGRATIPIAIACATVSDATSTRALVVTGICCTIAVAVVSEAFNQPINRRLMTMTPEVAQRELRAEIVRWSHFNALRLAAALTALVCFGASQVIGR
jgi:uncharacterized membrane protein